MTPETPQTDTETPFTQAAAQQIALELQKFAGQLQGEDFDERSRSLILKSKRLDAVNRWLKRTYKAPDRYVNALRAKGAIPDGDQPIPDDAGELARLVETIDNAMYNEYPGAWERVHREKIVRLPDPEALQEISDARAKPGDERWKEIVGRDPRSGEPVAVKQAPAPAPAPAPARPLVDSNWTPSRGPASVPATHVDKRRRQREPKQRRAPKPKPKPTTRATAKATPKRRTKEAPADVRELLLTVGAESVHVVLHELYQLASVEHSKKFGTRNVARVSVGGLAKRTGLSTPTIKRALAKLRELRIVRPLVRGSNLGAPCSAYELPISARHVLVWRSWRGDRWWSTAGKFRARSK